ncbi:LAME_0C02014g1_1 [Lachancea meyersii CBS 8951]|uniref:Clathrin light chain n=1 Tax=Lachancea meyersii CBS 8951 TaxID=1266667 RepID=A0A1G4IZL3_9SACH|nr:LAME_0C02014g1_1 [Lachancea meyersii CBS 8951]
MAEKFPPLENDTFEPESTSGQQETDFLKREAELLGDEFKTEEDSEFLQNADEDDFGDFEEVPARAHTDSAAAESQKNDFIGEDHQQSDSQNSSASLQAEDSQVIAEWEETRDREISERDTAQEEAKTKLQEEAVKHMDDFYDSYNRKKEQQLKTTRAEAEKFLKERQEFATQDNTTWDRVLQLINVDDADLVNGRDRSKFKEILLKVKGNPNAPGA